MLCFALFFVVFCHIFRLYCSTCPLYWLCCVLTLCRTLYRRYSPNDDVLRHEQHHHDQYDHYRDYWQRSTLGARVVAGRASAQAPVYAYPQGHSLPATTADVHHDDAYYWRLRDADHTTKPDWSGGKSLDERPVPPPRRRTMKNLQYLVEAGLVQPLGARLAKPKDREQVVHNYDFTPSNQASARGSFRSDGSGQSQVRRPFSQLSFAGSNVRGPPETEFGAKHTFGRSTYLHSSLPMRPQTLLPFHQRQVNTIYQPQDARFKTSSPTTVNLNFPQSFGSFTREFSSIREPSLSTGRQDPSNVQFLSHLHELPSLQPIHTRAIQQQESGDRNLLAQIGAQQSHISRPVTQPFYRATHDHSTLRATVPIGRSISQFAGRVLSRPPLLEPVPEAIYDSNLTARPQSTAGEFNEYPLLSLLFYK